MSHYVPKIALYEQKDIEVLLAYILHKVGPMTQEELLRCTVDQDTVKYFDFTNALMDMEEKGVIESIDDNGISLYSVTSKGSHMSLELFYTLPLSIRENTIYAAKRLTSRTRLEKSLKCEIIELEKGYHLYIRFLNEMGGADLMELKIYAPSFDAAQQMEKRFFDNPAGAYRSVLNNFIQGYLTVSDAEIKEAVDGQTEI